MRTCIVTGGAGFIGSRLIRALKARDWTPISFDIAHPFNTRTERQVDIRFAGALDSEVQRLDKKPDLIFHLAGPIAEGPSRNLNRALALQLDGTMSVMQVASAYGIKVILASSASVYLANSEEMVDERTPIDLLRLDAFAAVKLMSESIVRQHENVPQVILRLGSSYGYGGSSNVVETFLRAGLSGKPLQVWGSGKRVNQFTHVGDTVEALVLAADEPGAEGETINAIADQEVSTGQLASLMAQRFGFNVEYLSDQPEAPTMPFAISRKAATILGWRPVRIVEGLDLVAQEARQLASV